VELKIGCRFEVPKNSLSSGHMAGEWPRNVSRMSSDCIREMWPCCKCYVH
jgi:hypothetical protein